MSSPLNRTLLAVVAASALGFGLSDVALASGGGGGGGGGLNAPSARPSVDVAAVYRDGVAAYQAGDYRAAEKAMRSVTREVRNNAQAHYILGLSRMAQEKWRPASRALKKAIRYDEANYDARTQLGLAYLQQDKADKAAEQMAELDALLAACADACDPKLTGAADTLRSAISPEAGEDTAARYTPVPINYTVEGGDAAYLDAVRLINIGLYDEALDQLDHAQDVFGPHPDVLTYIGFANRKAGNYRQAINFYSAALELAPDHVGANEYLGEYYVELGDMEAAYGQLAKLEAICDFGCAETDELRDWINRAEAKSS